MNLDQGQLQASSRGIAIRSGPVGHAWLAWIVIVILCGTVVVGHNMTTTDAEAESSEDSIGVMIMTFQSQVLVGAAEFPGQQGKQMWTNAAALNTGSVAQRQRFIVLAAELAGPDEAHLQRGLLDELIADVQAESQAPVLNEQQVQVQEILTHLYASEDLSAAVESLDAVQRDVIVQELGWFGQLALVPPGVDQDARQAVLRRARTVAIIFTTAMLLAATAMLAGIIVLIVLLVLVLNGSLRGGLSTGRAHHGIYAETFAVWLLLFFALHMGAAAAGQVFVDAGMMFAFIAFFVSLVALAWPWLRGVYWVDVRRDIGLTLGRRPVVEPMFGVLGYIVALPMLAVGLVLTIVLIMLHDTFSAGEADELSPMTGPAHPVVEQLAGASWWPVIQILLVAAVAAPIVEEIMFRGVLYRHLRGATDPAQGDLRLRPAAHSHAATALSIVASGTINGFLFAVIHPQGLLAVPALMSLAYAFVLVREWRDTIVPAVIVHAISNGLVMSLLIFMISSGAD